MILRNDRNVILVSAVCLYIFIYKNLFIIFIFCSHRFLKLLDETSFLTHICTYQLLMDESEKGLEKIVHIKQPVLVLSASFFFLGKL